MSHSFPKMHWMSWMQEDTNKSIFYQELISNIHAYITASEINEIVVENTQDNHMSIATYYML